MLDIASGDDCNLYFIENPGAVAPVRYWRPLLGAKLHAAWKLLGWASSAPYDKAHVYEIARGSSGCASISCRAPSCSRHAPARSRRSCR